ncbi:hypothetical protein SLS62_001738 [Diatrype stigma]|uniref:C2H2-type domain-containing protein n=1 Tax=Diatrype stigma TaxID=117547 RepID=A0AAN9UYB2_9PEZI
MKRSRELEEDEGIASPWPERRAADDEGLDRVSPPAAAAPAEVRAYKIAGLDESAIDDNDDSSPAVAMRCSLPPHRDVLAFKTYGDYEVHYSKAHTNRCAECGRNLPSEHLLGVHIEECHDAFAALRREKGEHTYSCFVEGCDRKCRTPQKRRMHLIDKHMYPKNYFFAVTKEGVDGRRSMLLEGGHRRRASSSATSTGGGGGGVGGAPTNGAAAAKRHSLRQAEALKKGETTEPRPSSAPKQQQQQPTASPRPPKGESVDVAMEDLAGAMSALRFVPPSIRFGHGKGKSGFSTK